MNDVFSKRPTPPTPISVRLQNDPFYASSRLLEPDGWEKLALAPRNLRLV